MEYISKSENETYKIAQKLFAESSFGDIYALSGDLGSGKTAFVKAYAEASGIKKTLTSPTFVILKQYLFPSSKKDNSKYLIHVDCYRMGSEEDAFSIGLPEYFDRKDTVIFIEWPEKISKILPKSIKNIKFEYMNETTRKITVED